MNAIVAAILAANMCIASPAHAATPQCPNARVGVLHMVNRERAAHGLWRLHVRRDLEVSAHRHNVVMGKDGRMAHRLPGEQPFGKRIYAAGYYAVWTGENIGYNYVRTMRGVLYLELKMYRERPPEDTHRQNILSTRYTSIGIDVYCANNRVWLTEDFGGPYV